MVVCTALQGGWRDCLPAMEGNAHGRTMYDDVSTVPAGQQWHTACCRSCCCIPRIAAAMLCAEETMRTKADQNMMERARARHASWMQRNKLPYGSKKQSWAKLDFYIISKTIFLGVDQCQFPDQCQSEHNTEFRYTNTWKGSRTRRPENHQYDP